MTGRRILVVGRGTAGRALADDVRRQGDAVVGFLDDAALADDVLGTLDQVDDVVAAHAVDAVYFAIPSIDAGRLRAFLDRLDASQVAFSMVPRTYETLSRETVAVDDLSDVDVLDLVGRKPVKHDLEGARSLVSGRRVLVTGAAGSIGSRLAGLLVALGAAEVVCLDWWENGVFQLQHRLPEVDDASFVVADVKNRARLDAVFSRLKPELVFHAAAYKHVPLMQQNPAEAIANNVGGTDVVLSLAVEHGASHVVYVSTDKAVNPANVMGASKRLGELLVADWAVRASDVSFSTVRFGNVIQSNGSVMETFRRQIREGGPITVTDPEVTRFFMTIDEASQLIIQSAVVGASGDICVLDMGEPVRIQDLARSLVRTTAPGVEIVFTGLRPGEKLYEELSYDPDLVAHTAHDKIFVLRESEAAAATPDEIRAFVAQCASSELSDAEVVERLRDMGFAIR